MRNHVLRLLGVLADEATSDGVRIFVCIDGIDHAARANTPLSFLSSLPLPSEIPDGVCFVIVGQPSAVYREQYPTWLSTSEDVDRVSMPKLCVGDIEQLILSQAKRFARNASGLASLIFEKTEGNNLSAVFAVEEVKALQTLDDAVEQIRSSGITADIQQYYEHIWAHMKIELSRIVKAATFPESIVACPLLLMNGRVNVRILARALAAYGDLQYCIPNTLNICFDGVSSEALMLATKQYCGISNGSACNSHSYSPSYVLTAMGLPVEQIESSIRISWGPLTDIQLVQIEFGKMLSYVKSMQ